MTKSMDEIVSLCKRRGFIFQDSDIYGGQNGFWDYGPLGTLLKRNVRNTWYQDMVDSHNELIVPPGAPEAYQMVGVETALIMHPQVWKCSGHYDMFHDMMVDCRESKKRYRYDHIKGRWVTATPKGKEDAGPETVFITAVDAEDVQEVLNENALRYFGLKKKYLDRLEWAGAVVSLPGLSLDKLADAVGPDASKKGTLTEPREFNLMFKTTIGALGGEDDTAFLRPETAQGIFVNFKNVVDTSRVKVPFGVAQVGKSFRNEITPRNFTFRSREFEQMEIEFFCKPEQSKDWYLYWRDKRFQWYQDLGIASESLILREHEPAELSHYSCATSDVEYAFPFLEPGEFGELEGIAHRGDFDLRSHSEGKLVEQGDQLIVELNEHGQPKYRGSGKDLSYFDDETRERFIPHVIEPSAGADRGTLAFICEAYHEDEQPDDKGELQKRVVMKFHPRLAPVKAAVFPLVKKDGQPEKAQEIYAALKAAGLSCQFDQQGAIGRRYRRQDEIGTPFCITVDHETISDGTVTIRDRDSLDQVRIPVDEVVSTVQQRLQS